MNKVEVYDYDVMDEYCDIKFGRYNGVPAVLYPSQYGSAGNVVAYELIVCTACFVNANDVQLYARYEGDWDVTAPCMFNEHVHKGAYFFNDK